MSPIELSWTAKKTQKGPILLHSKELYIRVLKTRIAMNEVKGLYFLVGLMQIHFLTTQNDERLNNVP